MNFCFNQWPERGEAIELWLTKLEGEGTSTQASFEFDRKAAEEKAAGINAAAPGVATVVGPFVLASRRGGNRAD